MIINFDYVYHHLLSRINVIMCLWYIMQVYDLHDITEILLKVALNTKTLTLTLYRCTSANFVLIERSSKYINSQGNIIAAFIYTHQEDSRWSVGECSIFIGGYFIHEVQVQVAVLNTIF